MDKHKWVFYGIFFSSSLCCHNAAAACWQKNKEIDIFKFGLKIGETL